MAAQSHRVACNHWNVDSIQVYNIWTCHFGTPVRRTHTISALACKTGLANGIHSMPHTQRSICQISDGLRVPGKHRACCKHAYSACCKLQTALFVDRCSDTNGMVAQVRLTLNRTERSKGNRVAEATKKCITLCLANNNKLLACTLKSLSHQCETSVTTADWYLASLAHEAHTGCYVNLT